MHRGKLPSFSMFFREINRIAHQVVKTQGHILRRNSNRFSGRRQENIVWRHHQQLGFKLCFNRKRHINGHLVTVKVGVKRCADERMDADRFTFDQAQVQKLGYPRRCSVGARFRRTGCPLMISSRTSQTSGACRWIIFLAERMV